MFPQGVPDDALGHAVGVEALLAGQERQGGAVGQNRLPEARLPGGVGGMVGVAGHGQHLPAPPQAGRHQARAGLSGAPVVLSHVAHPARSGGVGVEGDDRDPGGHDLPHPGHHFGGVAGGEGQAVDPPLHHAAHGGEELVFVVGVERLQEHFRAHGAQLPGGEFHAFDHHLHERRLAELADHADPHRTGGLDQSTAQGVGLVVEVLGQAQDALFHLGAHVAPAMEDPVHGPPGDASGVGDLFECDGHRSSCPDARPGVPGDRSRIDDLMLP